MDFESRTSHSESQLSLSSSISWRNFPLKKIVFQILYQAFKTNPKSNKANRVQTLLLYLFGVLQMCYFSSLILSDCTNPGFVTTIRDIVTFIRYESIFVRYSLETDYSTAHYAIISLPYLSFTAEFLFKVLDRKMPFQSIRYLITWPIRYFQLVGFVPLMVLMQAKLCYWMTKSGTSIYAEVNDSIEANWGSADAAIALLFLVLLCVLLLCGLFFDYNVYYNSKKRSFLARGRSFEYFTHLLGKAFIITMLTWTYDTNKFWVEAIFAICGGLTAYIFITRAPFYDMNCNVVFTWTSIGIMWIGFAKFLGRILDSEGVTVLLILVVLPILLAILHSQMCAMYASDLSCQSHTSFQFFQIEKILRAEIERMEQTSGIQIEVIEQLFRRFNSDVDTMNKLSLFEAAFYVHECDDYEKAWISLIKFEWGHPTWESEFQKFKLQEYIRAMFQAGETIYLEHLTRMDTMKVLDEQSCWAIYNFCTELLDSNAKAEKCEKLADQATKSLNVLRREYRAALASQPKNIQLHFMFGTFMSDILSDPAGQIFIQRAESNAHHLSQRGVSLDSFTSFDTAGTVCISCTKQRLGMMDLVNDTALDVLGYTRTELMSMNVMELLPEVMQKSTHEILTDIVLERKPMTVLLSFFSILVDSKGFLVPLKPFAKVISQDQHSFIFLSFQRDAAKEALALIDSHGYILSHSDKFAEYSQFTEAAYFIGYCLRDVFPEMPDDLGEDLQVNLTTHPGFAFYKRKMDLCKPKRTVYKVIVVRTESNKSMDANMTLRVMASNTSKKEVRFLERRASVFDPQALLKLEQPTEGSQLPNLTSEPNKKEQNTRHSLLNSEMSLSANIRTPIEESLISKIKLTARRFKLLLLVANVLVIATIVATSIFMINLIMQMQQLNVLSELSQRRHLSIDIASLTRKLIMSPDANSTRILQDSLSIDVKDYRNSIDRIKQEFSGWVDGPNKRMYQEPSTVIVERINGAMRISKVDLFECMYKFSDNAIEVANSPNLSHIQSSIYYVLRNGPAESLFSVNRSMFLYVDSESKYRDQQFGLIEALVMVSGVVLVIGMMVLVFPQIFLIEKYHILTWETLYAANFALIIETKHRARDRLQSLHYNEISDTEGYIKDPRKHKRPIRLWPVLILKLGIIFAVSAAFFLGIFVGVYPSLKLLMQTMPNYLNWGGIRSTVTHGASYWARENYLTVKDRHSYEYEFKDNSLWPSADAAFTNFTQTFRFLMQLLKSKNPNYGIYSAQDSSAYKEFRYYNACFDGNSIDSCDATPIGLGLNYAITEYINTADFLRKLEATGQAEWRHIELIDSQKSSLFQATSYGLDFYKSQADTQIESQKLMIILATTIYTASLVLLFFVYYVGLINNLSRRLCDRAALLKILKSS